MKAYDCFGSKCNGCAEYAEYCNCEIDSNGNLIDPQPIVCPFCGIKPDMGGRMLSRDQKSTAQIVSHQDTGKCSLDMLVFRLPEWNTRHSHD